MKLLSVPSVDSLAQYQLALPHSLIWDIHGTLFCKIGPPCLISGQCFCQIRLCGRTDCPSACCLHMSVGPSSYEASHNRHGMVKWILMLYAYTYTMMPIGVVKQTTLKAHNRLKQTRGRVNSFSLNYIRLRIRLEWVHVWGVVREKVFGHIPNMYFS